jgi:Ca-activated chloride channel family protein
MVLYLTAALLTAAVFAAPQATPRAAAGSSTPQGTVTIVGSVVNERLSPIAGALVVLERNGRSLMTATTDAAGVFRFERVTAGDYRARASHDGFAPLARNFTVPAGPVSVRLPLVLTSQSANPGGAGQSNFTLDGSSSVAPSGTMRPESMTTAAQAPLIQALSGERSFAIASVQVDNLPMVADSVPEQAWHRPNRTHERYASVEPGSFHRSIDDPLSTFGADVDTASFANVRRLLQGGQRPPAEAVRVEEFVNYFRYAYPMPGPGRPIGLTAELGDCPWAPTHKLVLIGARAASPTTGDVAGRNIVLLIDVSGSMRSQDKLPLLKAAFNMFVETLRPDDRIAIVTYAGSAGLALPSTPARDRQTIHAAIDRLGAGGSTNGGQGIIQAYRIARDAFVPGGVNRVILATDGDFNVGIVGQTDLLKLIQREKESGVFLSVFGVGTDNIKDDTMEMLADKGNGHYAYLDSLQEARRVLVTESDSTLETVAKDTKFQVEFNPAQVEAWKLIGYENRQLTAPDFNDDRKDGGELGAGHTVTVLYEVVPAGAASADDAAIRPRVDPLKYQPARGRPTTGPARVSPSAEWLTVKVRYQQPEGEQSRLIQLSVKPGAAEQPIYVPFASAVAEFGLLLRDVSASRQRWDALERRVASMSVGVNRAVDQAQLLELIELGKTLR